MRDRITTALELLGLASITTGAAVFNPALGFVVGGAALFALGLVQGGRLDDDKADRE